MILDLSHPTEDIHRIIQQKIRLVGLFLKIVLKIGLPECAQHFHGM